MEQNAIYFTPDGRPQMRRSYCAFMDVLGFTDITKSSFQYGIGEELFQRMYSVISNQVKSLKEHREEATASVGSLWELKVFTDNIVLGYPVFSPESDRELMDIMSEVADYQLAMALQGFFVRGGLTLDLLFMDEHLVYGPALLEAYDLENKSARDPRIIISAQVREAVDRFSEYNTETGEAPYTRNLLLDADGQIYIHYLERLISDEPTGPVVDWANVFKHKEQIEEKLQRHSAEPIVWAKYYWLANYHDFFCGQWSHSKGYEESYRIDPLLTRRYPSRLAT